MAALSVDDEVFAAGPERADSGDLPGRTRIAHARIARWLERLILSGRLQVGDRLPAEADLATALGVSRMTLRQALSGVEAKGLIERRRGRFGGNFVTRPRFDYSLAGLPGFTEQMHRAHVEAGARVVRAGVRRPAEDVRAALRLRRGQSVYEVIRIRSADGEPIALEEAYLPARLFDGLLSRDLTESLYRVMGREYALAPESAQEVIEPVVASPRQAELLDVRPGQPLLLIVRTSYAADDLPVEFSRDYFRPDRTRVVLRTQADRGPVAGVVAHGGTAPRGETERGATP